MTATTSVAATDKKTVATPKRAKPARSVLYPPRAARHKGLNITRLRKVRAKNRVAARSRRLNRAGR